MENTIDTIRRIIISEEYRNHFAGLGEYIRGVYGSLWPIAQCMVKNRTSYVDEYLSKVVRWEQSRGGLTVPRGYYFPSRIKDITATNGSRGRLLKRTPNEKHPPDYRYGFDKYDRLIFVDKKLGIAYPTNV